MSESSETNLCPSCRNEIPPNAPDGLCPRCVLKGAADDFTTAAASARSTARLFMEPPTLEEIQHAFPQLDILELVGSGGMGAVFKARQPKLDRIVALKVLPKSLAGDAHFTERFTREARALARLNHPNIVSVHDFGESDTGGFHFLLMEYVDGANLREAMQAGRFTPQQAFAVVPEICAALQYAHDEGVLHRDIKPENLLLDTKGRVKIVDFGIAKLVGAEIDAPLTGSYAPGTPQYMAPEQIEHPTEVDHRADIYSLGVVFYEMLTGELPIGRFAAPSEKATVGGDVDSIVFRTLEKEPDRRQQSAGEVKTQVEGIGDDPQDLTPPLTSARVAVSEADQRTRSRRAGRGLLWVCGLVVVMLVAWGALLSWVKYQHSYERRDMARNASQIERIRSEVDLLERELRSGKAAGMPEADTMELEKLAEDKREQLKSLEQSLKRGSGMNRGMLGALIVVSVVCGVFVLVATVRAWQLLGEFRITGQRRGRVSALITAMFLPLAILSTLIFLIFVLPARGHWVGPAFSLSAVAVIVVNIWLVIKAWQWSGAPANAEQITAWETKHRATTTSPQPRSGGKTLWLVLGMLLLLPILLVGSCVAYTFAAYNARANAVRRADEALMHREKAIEAERMRRLPPSIH